MNFNKYLGNHQNLIMLCVLLVIGTLISTLGNIPESSTKKMKDSEKIFMHKDTSKYDAFYVEAFQNLTGVPLSSAGHSDLKMSTILGASNDDFFYDMTIDKTGCVYICGGTASTLFPTTPGALNRTHNGNYDIFLVKISADGTSLLYSTLLGGPGDDRAFEVAIDTAGNIILSGITSSSLFPTTLGAYNRTYGGSTDGFICKISPDGTVLLNSTFLGGSGYDSMDTMEIDEQNNIYIVGYTSSPDFPTTSGVLNETNGGNGCIFIIKLSTNFTTLSFSTFFGSFTDTDEILDMCIDSDKNIYFIGVTTSSIYPTTPNAIKSTNIEGEYDCIITKISSDAKSLLYSTYFGGDKSEYGQRIGIDEKNNIYICGSTESSATQNLTTTPDVINQTHNGDGMDAFVSKISADGNILVYSTFIGSSGQEKINAMYVDPLGSVIIGGYTNFIGLVPFPTTSNALNQTHNGNWDVFMMKINPEGSSILYSTLLGGSALDSGQEICIDTAGYVYIAGTTQSAAFPTTLNAINQTTSGLDDVFVSKIDIGPRVPILITTNQITFYNNLTVQWNAIPDVIQYNLYINGIFNTTVNGIEHNLLFNSEGIYNISVTAIRNGYESLPSNTLIITVDLIPQTPTWITTSQIIYIDNLTVSWNAVPGTNLYKIYVNSTLNTTTTDTQQKIMLNSEGFYAITITAVRNGYESPLSNTLIITVDLIPQIPTWITTSQIIYFDNLTVSWNAVSGANLYRIYVNSTLNTTTTDTQQKIMLNSEGFYAITITAVRNGYESHLSNAIIIQISMNNSLPTTTSSTSNTTLEPNLPKAPGYPSTLVVISNSIGFGILGFILYHKKVSVKKHLN